MEYASQARPEGLAQAAEVNAWIVVQPDGSLAIGPLETLAQIAAHPEVRRTHTALARACGEAASPQIRNVATIGGMAGNTSAGGRSTTPCS